MMTTRAMPLPTMQLLKLGALAAITTLGVGCNRSAATASSITALVLTNGIRVVSVHFAASTNVSIFTFVPMSLTSDGPNQAQWSHLVEHLVIRSTVPANSSQANAETLPDHMRLDFYGNEKNWREGLSHHRRWLDGEPFTEVNLAAEKLKVVAECDFTARNFATHKFAVAAWSHGFRHSAKHVALKGDVTKAMLADVQRLRDERLVVSNRVTVCIVSGLEANTVFAEAEKQLNALRLQAAWPPASNTIAPNLDLTWDLDARHLLVTWPIPDFRQPNHSALMVAAQGLNIRLASDPDLKSKIGMAFAGADLATPEGNFFFISAALRPGADADGIRKTILGLVERLATTAGESAQAALIGRQFAASFTEIPDPQTIKAQVPAGMGLAMIEGNLGLQAGVNEHRYGAYRNALAQQLADVSPRKVQEVAQRHLALDKAAVCTLQPATPSGSKP